MITFFAKQIDDDGAVIALHSFIAEAFPDNPYFIEITEDEYTNLMENMEQTEEKSDQISDSEALSIILGEVEA